MTTTRRRFWNYPRPGYRGLHRWLPSWRFVLLSMISVIGLVAGLGVAAYSSVKIPDSNADVRDQTTTVYFADPARSGDPSARGEKMGQYPGVKREIIPCDEADAKSKGQDNWIPQHVKDAVVASEDRSFWTNSGVDPRGIARALYNNLRGGNRQGASTLTQQYVDNYYGGSRHGYLGKAQEALLAVKINQEQSKDQIICRYLNTIYWGRGKTYGIQTAARSYLGKDAKDLDVSEAALLAGIIPSPINWDPADNREKAEQRWNRTLDYMVADPNLKTGLTAAQRAELTTFPQVLPYQPEPVYAGPNGYLMVEARKEAADQVCDRTKTVPCEEQLMRGGYTIITTIDQEMQAMAVESGRRLIEGELSGGKTPNLCDPDEDPDCRGTLRVAMVTLDPADGSIRAMYSGQDFLADQYNRVTQGRAQAGSTFKPFTLVAALQDGISLRSVYSGTSPRTFDVPGKDWKVNNFGNTSYGDMDLIKATADSVNTVYAELNIEVGPERTADVAKTAGITAAGAYLSQAPSNVLGSDAVRPLDMAQAYGVFAAQGLQAKPHIVSRILGPDGETVYDADTRAARVFDADVMADTVTALQGPVKSGSARDYVGVINRHIAGKTGTSSDNKSAWFVGFTTDVVTAVALTQEGPGGSEVSITPWGNGVSQVTGGTWPAALWADYMAGCGGKKSASACKGGVLALPPYSKNNPFPPAANLGTSSTPSPTDEPTDEPTETTEAPPDTVVVPALEKRYEADAVAALSGLGFSPNVVSEPSATVRSGAVIRVEPAAGTSLPYGDTVTIVVSNGPPPVVVPPDVGDLPGGAQQGNGQRNDVP
ncbi:MAG: penicillin-binding protein [Micrococcales bacterium]|nr:penicillin-binding protein [Micrococcales bacterium]